MDARRNLFAATRLLVAVSLILGPAPRAVAQDAQPGASGPEAAPPLMPPLVPPGAEAPPAAASMEVDPPARVGRVARVSGAVSFHPANADQWDRAQMNWPVTSGSGFWTEPGASAQLELPSGRILLNGGSQLEIDRLDASQMAATLRQGNVYLRPSALAPGESYRIRTPRALVSIATPGRYEIVVGDTSRPTQIVVYQGAAQIGEGSSALQVLTGQAIVIAGNDNFTMRVEQAGPDPFQARVAPPQARYRQAVVPPPVVAEMPGGADLVQYGSWEPNADYGQVWYPQVAPGWVPYRDGHWGYVAPWGWTWIDAAPWGFAPFHYGRWFQYGGRWGWTPGGYAVAGGPVYAPPVYAPALVTFLGVGVGVGIAAGFASGPGTVGWLPLGPREPYRPWYRASPAYQQNVNYPHVPPGGNGGDRNFAGDPRGFRNIAAATQVPAAVMTASRPVRPAARPLSPAQFGQVHPLAGQPPVQPSLATAGITPGMARQLNVAVPGAGPGAGPGAAGPSAAGPGAAGPGAVGPGAVGRRAAPGPALPPQSVPGSALTPPQMAVPQGVRPPVAGAPIAGAPMPGFPPHSGIATPPANRPASAVGPVPAPTAGAPPRPGLPSGAVPPQTVSPQTAPRQTVSPTAAPPPAIARPPGAPPAGTRPTAAPPAVMQPQPQIQPPSAPQPRQG